MDIKRFFQSHSVGFYFSLVFLISWGGTFLLGLGDFLRGAEPQLPDVLPMVVIMLAAPMVSGIAMTYLTDGKEGLRDLFARMLKWKVGGRWYLALLIFPVLILAVQIPLSFWFNPGLVPIFNPIGIISGVMAGVQEEIGWMGFVYPKMRRRFSVLRASIVLGLIHALWHAPADFLGNFNGMQEDWLPYFAGFFVFVVALRIIIAWMYENTQSLLMAILAHAFSTGFLGILVPTANAAEIWPGFYAVYSIALWFVAARIMMRNRVSITEQPSKSSQAFPPSWKLSGN